MYVEHIYILCSYEYRGCHQRQPKPEQFVSAKDSLLTAARKQDDLQALRGCLSQNAVLAADSGWPGSSI